jgi:hypothetical protein
MAETPYPFDGAQGMLEAKHGVISRPFAQFTLRIAEELRVTHGSCGGSGRLSSALSRLATNLSA